MKLEQIETFVTVVDEGTIQATAAKLAKTQPAITMKIKKLEDSLGFELFDRSQYKLKLTPKGKAFYNKSQLIVDQLHQLKSYSKELINQKEFEIAIAIEDIVETQSIYKALKKFQLVYPNVELKIITESRFKSLQRLANREIDFAITPWLLTFSSEGNFDTKTIDNFNITYCIHKELAATVGIHNAADIEERHLMTLPQLMPSEFAIKLNGIPILHRIGHSIVQVNDYNALISSLTAQLGWGPIASTTWTPDMEKNFFQFKVDPKSTVQNSEIRVARNSFSQMSEEKLNFWDYL